MFIKKRLPLFIAIIFIVEILIYLWSAWTSTFAEGNFFGIQSPFIFDKCARLAGRISSGLILSTLLMVGYYGLRKIYSDDKKKDSFLFLHQRLQAKTKKQGAKKKHQHSKVMGWQFH